MTARLISAGSESKFSLRVRPGVAGETHITVSNAAASGSLSVKNSAWSRHAAGRWTVTCSGRAGQALFEQRGLGGLGAVVVRVTDVAGGVTVRTLLPS